MYDTSKLWQWEWWWLIIELRNAVIAGFLLLLRSPPFYPPSFHLARSQINGWGDDDNDDDGGGDYDDSSGGTGALVVRPTRFFKSRFKKLFGILGWDILDVSDLFLFECCIHNRLARRMQIQEPMVLLLLGEASWCKFLLGGRPPDAVDLMFFLCCCLHEYYDWPPSALSLSFAITNTLIIQKSSPEQPYYIPFENHINILQNVFQIFCQIFTLLCIWLWKWYGFEKTFTLLMLWGQTM